MSNYVSVNVTGIRLEEETDTPIMLLHDPISDRFLPIWIGTIEAVSIAYAQEGYIHPRPQTHDLLVSIIESLNAKLTEVCITDVLDKTYYAELKLNSNDGLITLSCRPSDAIALALRSDATISVNDKLFLENSILIFDNENIEIEEFNHFIDNITPEDFF